MPTIADLLDLLTAANATLKGRDREAAFAKIDEKIKGRYTAANELVGRARAQALETYDAEIREWNRGVNRRNRAAKKAKRTARS